MDREIAKFIVENFERLNQIFAAGGKGTIVTVGPKRFTIDEQTLAYYSLSLVTMRAYVNGAEIEYNRDGDDGWCGIAEPSFIAPFLYRVKPEPRVYTLAVYKQSGQVHHIFPAGSQFPVNSDKFEYIKVREIQ